MAQVFNIEGLRRTIFNFKSNSFKEETKKKYDMVMSEFQTHLKDLYEDREGHCCDCQGWTEIMLDEISNISQNEYFNYYIKKEEEGYKNKTHIGTVGLYIIYKYEPLWS